MHPGNDPASQILDVLKFRPRGMTITEIARHTAIPRNSAAKYLELLRVSGKVDLRPLGSAKVFSIAQRVPMSAFLCFTRNFILVLDNHGRIIQINDRFLAYAGARKDDVIGKTITEASLPVVSSPEALALIRELDHEQVISDVRYQHNDGDVYYRMQVIPTILDDGKPGCTIVLEDVTLIKRYIRNMEFLARTAMELVDMPADADIYRYIAERIAEIVPGARVNVNSYDDATGKFFIRAIADQDFRTALQEVLGRDLIGMEIPLQEIFSPSFGDQSLKKLQPGFIEFLLATEPGPGVVSIYDLCFHTIPKERCDEILRSQNIGKVSASILSWRGQLFGDVLIFQGPDETLENMQAVDSFTRQASIAISQRMTAERLRQSEERFREVVDLFPNPASIIDGDGRYIFLNRAFTEMFGYTPEDIPTGSEWFQSAFPDREYRKNALETWKSDLKRSETGESRPRTFRVRCKNGLVRNILFQPVTLSDGLQFVTYADVSGK